MSPVSTSGFELRTKAKLEMLDISDKAQRAVAESGIREGIALFHVPHATASLLVNENERGLVQDMEDTVRELIPWNKGFRHDRIDDNAASHILSGLLGCSLALPVSNGALLLGTWQSVFLLELDGPRARRRVIVQVVGE